MRRPFLLSLLAIALVGAAPHGASAPSEVPKRSERSEQSEQSERSERPNILIVLADDLGFSDIGGYGGEIATPNLDALAKGGLRFTQFYNTGRCWPTRAAVMTGYYAQQVRRDTFDERGGGQRNVRPAWAPLLSVMLQSLGYRTYHSGKWHIDGKPLQNGFDRSYDLADHNRHFSPTDHFEDDKPLQAVQRGSGYYTSTALADHAIKSLKEHAENYSERPFFEYLCFTAPHFPLQAPPEDIARYRDKYLRGWDAMRQERWRRLLRSGIGGRALSAIERDIGPPYAFPDALKALGPDDVNRPVPWDTLTPAQRELQATKMAIHAAMVDRMDTEIGRVLDQVRKMGALDNTIVIFLSDNGASAEMMVRGDGHDRHAEPGSASTYLSLGPGWSTFSNTPFRRHKTWQHEGGVSTPFVVHWPKGIAARGELRHTPAHVIDIVPTVVELVTGKPFVYERGTAAPRYPGKSLVPALKRNVTIARDSIWFSHEGNRALRVGNWKLVAAGKDAPWELYDLSKDRSESKNLAAQKPEIVRDLTARWLRETADYKNWAEQEAQEAPTAPTGRPR